jgi:DNA repair protein RadC
MKDVHDSTVSKMWGIFLNEDYCSIGNEPLALGEHAEPKNFVNMTGNIYRYYTLFGAKRYVLVTNHISNDATPTEADKELIRRLNMDTQNITFRPILQDYVIVAGDHYWSMTTQNGTACHCGQQHYWEGE